MISSCLGYIFECRTDCTGAIGVMESYRALCRGNSQNVSIVCAVDSMGKIITPAINDLSTGFKPLNMSCFNVDDVQRFIKSNKPFFGKFGEFTMLVAGTISYDIQTGQLLSTKDLNLYIPKMVSENVEGMVDTKGNQVPALICDVVSTKKGLNVFEVSEAIYNAYLQNFLCCLNKDVTSSKFNYLCHLILKEC